MLERLGFSFCNGGCFKVLLLRVYSTSWPWSQDAYQLGRLARQRWSHHNHKTPPNPLSSGLQDHRCQNVQPERLPTRRGESCGDHQVAHQWGRIFLLVTSGTESHHWPDHGCPKDSQVVRWTRCILLTGRWFRFPEQSDNRFFWNRMLYLPYVRAGVSTSDWLIKVGFWRRWLPPSTPYFFQVMFGSVEIRTVYVGAKQVGCPSAEIKRHLSSHDSRFLSKILIEWHNPV